MSSNAKMDSSLNQKNATKQEMPQATRRDFLKVTTGIAGCCGAAALAWPFIAQLQPDSATLAASTVEVDISAVEAGTSLIIPWRGKPVVIRNRSVREIELARASPLEGLKDSRARNANLDDDARALDEARSAGKGRENWLIMVNLCTHLGCVPILGTPDKPGWFCPCHGSSYDTAGRVLTGPAGQNMAIPPYQFITDSLVRIG